MKKFIFLMIVIITFVTASQAQYDYRICYRDSSGTFIECPSVMPMFGDSLYLCRYVSGTLIYNPAITDIGWVINSVPFYPVGPSLVVDSTLEGADIYASIPSLGFVSSHVTLNFIQLYFLGMGNISCFMIGGSISVTAVPDPGYTFLYWETGSKSIIYDNPYVFPLSSAVDLTAYFSVATSITDNEIQSFTFYPNPAESVIHFQEGLYFIYDISGKLVLSGNSSSADVSNLKAGTYLFKSENTSTKFIKK